MDFKKKEKSEPPSYTSAMARKLAYGGFAEESGEVKRILMHLDGLFVPKFKPGPTDWLT